ncbi:MAG TPA: hypothetical protein PKD64_02950 [Pirellulaceae bacterium]|nr:hypothetical protein [Pirellulaceae bacterium]HMO91127.1 hypothetical protein [Pirellulaceae bacterium]HMP71067.1 hypothetical protein [Pirellulaceae bacterium]
MVTPSTLTNSTIPLHFSRHLRPYFLTLARRVQRWADAKSRNITIGVASVRKHEGRSTVALNLAAAFTNLLSETTLLVEADFGNGHWTRRMRAQLPGLSELIAGTATPGACIYGTSIEGLKLMGCGRLSTREMQEKQIETLSSINRELNNDFKAIVYDLPVFNEISLSLLLGQFLDGVILVVDSNHADKKAIERFRKSAEDMNIEIVGIVLNRILPNQVA